MAVDRPDWDEYFLNISTEVARRATCRLDVGAVLVKNKRILATGYNGSPVGLPHCNDVGCLLHDVVDSNGHIAKHCLRTAHAEQNAIAQAAMHGVSTEGATLYCTDEPCLSCAKILINAGITKVVCKRPYHDAKLSRDFFAQAGVAIVVAGENKQESKS